MAAGGYSGGTALRPLTWDAQGRWLGPWACAHHRRAGAADGSEQRARSRIISWCGRPPCCGIAVGTRRSRSCGVGIAVGTRRSRSCGVGVAVGTRRSRSCGVGVAVGGPRQPCSVDESPRARACTSPRPERGRAGAARGGAAATVGGPVDQCAVAPLRRRDRREARVVARCLHRGGPAAPPRLLGGRRHRRRDWPPTRRCCWTQFLRSQPSRGSSSSRKKSVSVPRTSSA